MRDREIGGSRARKGGLAVTLAVVFVGLVCRTIPGSALQGQARPVAVNTVVPLLDQDKPIFGHMVNYWGVGSDRESAVGHSQEAATDFVVYDLEHSAFDVSKLGEYMQWLLDRATIARTGGITATKSVFVRLPINGRETNQWVVKNVLDQGVHGLVFPLTETSEQVLHAIRAMRYPQKAGVPDFEPDGIRGASPAVAAPYWGLSSGEYMQRADIWKLDPQGSMLPIFIIENALGVTNVRDIARTLKERGIGAILWAGRGDLGVSYGGDQAAVAKGLDAVLAAGKEFGIPVALNMPEDVSKRYAQGARMFVGIGTSYAPPSADVRRGVGR